MVKLCDTEKWLKENGVMVTPRMKFIRRMQRLKCNMGFNQGEKIKLSFSIVPCFLWNANLFSFREWPCKYRRVVHLFFGTDAGCVNDKDNHP